MFSSLYNRFSLKQSLGTPGMSAKRFTNVSLKKSSTRMKSQKKWLSEDAVIGNLEVNWENTYHLPFLCTTETNFPV